MTKREANKLLKNNPEVTALDLASYVLLSALALELLYKGVSVARIKKGF